MEFQTWFAFVGASIALLLIPGPTVLLVLSYAMSQGKKVALATVGGVAANLAGFSIPDWLSPTTNRIGQAALALGLMAAGAGMQLGRMALARTLAVQLLTTKHVLVPVAALGVAWLWQLDPVASTVLLMFSAVPTASSCYVLAARMGYDGAYVAGLVTVSTVLGMVSLPFALGWLAQFR